MPASAESAPDSPVSDRSAVDLPGRYRFVVIEFASFLEDVFGFSPIGTGVEHHVESVLVFVFRVDAVSREATTQTVGPFVHGFNGADDEVSSHELAVFRHQTGY